MEGSSMSVRAGAMRDRRDANVMANRENRLHKARGSAQDAPSRTLSTKERAHMMKAQRSVSSSGRAGAKLGGGSGGARTNSDGKDGLHGGASARPERRERTPAARGTPLATLLESVDLQPMLGLFEEQRITFEVLAQATDAELRELLANESLDLKLGEQQALRNGLRSIKHGGQEGSDRSAAKVARTGRASTAAEDRHEDVRTCTVRLPALSTRRPYAAYLTQLSRVLHVVADAGELLAGRRILRD
jgi:hypothetical protein